MQSIKYAGVSWISSCCPVEIGAQETWHKKNDDVLATTIALSKEMSSVSDFCLEIVAGYLVSLKVEKNLRNLPVLDAFSR